MGHHSGGSLFGGYRGRLGWSRRSSFDGECGQIRTLARERPEVPGEAILKMGTWNGAEGLSLADRIGTVEAGKEASLAVVRLAGGAHRDSYARLFKSTSEVVATVIAGKLVAGRVACVA